MRHIALLSFLVLATTRADGAIRWEPFELPSAAAGLKAQLGHLTVPLDRKRPDSATADLVLVRLQSATPKNTSPIVYLAGGPGQAATPIAHNQYALPSLRRLAEIGDVILFDQRGTGQSTPRPVCAPEALEPEKVFASRDESFARVMAATRKCIDEWAAKDVPANAFNNRESAADIEDLRIALGAPKLKLIGFSYGTHLALAYIRAYGANVDRSALIATAGLQHMRKLPLMLDAQLAKLSLMVAQDPAIGREVPDMTALTREVLDGLAKNPLTVTVRDRQTKKDVRIPIDDETMRGFLVADIGDGNDFPYFPALLFTVKQRDATILEWFAEKRYNQRGGVNLMWLGMRCSAGASALRDQEIKAEAGVSIFLNTVNDPFPAICSALPAIDLGDDYRAPLISSAPVLFISGTLDAHTPPYQAEEIRWGMPNARHLIVQNAGHEDLEPSDEVQKVMADYLAGKDVSDRHVSLPTPRFLSVAEAKKDRHRE